MSSAALRKSHGAQALSPFFGAKAVEQREQVAVFRRAERSMSRRVSSSIFVVVVMLSLYCNARASVSR